MRTPALPLSLLAAIAGCSTSGEVRPAAASGRMAFVQAGAESRIYLPAPPDPVSGHARLAVLDAGAAAGASAFLRTIDLGVVGTVRAVGADGMQVVASGEDTRTLYFVDAKTDTVTGTASLPETAQLIVGSGGLSYTSGVTVDEGRRKAYVSVSYGILQYDLDSRQLTRTYEAPVPENFALDRETGILYVPFYLCDPALPDGPDVCTAYQQPGGPPLTDSMTLIDVGSGRSWSLVDPDASITWAPLGYEADMAVRDPSLGLTIVAIEAPTSVHVLDDAATTFDDAAGTCRMSGLAVPMPNDLHTELAVDTTTHILVAAREHAEDVSFVDLEEAKRGVVTRFDAQLVPPPGSGPFYNWGDPHGIVVGRVDGRPHVFLLSDLQTWMARIDMLGVAEVMNGSGTFSSHLDYISTGLP